MELGTPAANAEPSMVVAECVSDVRSSTASGVQFMQGVHTLAEIKVPALKENLQVPPRTLLCSSSTENTSTGALRI